MSYITHTPSRTQPLIQTRHLVNISEVQILLISLILESVNQVRIRGSQICSRDQLILALVLALQVEAEENDGHGHAGVAGEVDTPGNVVAGCVPVEEDLWAWRVLLVWRL